MVGDSTKEDFPWLPDGFQHIHTLITMFAYVFHMENTIVVIALLRDRPRCLQP